MPLSLIKINISVTTDIVICNLGLKYVFEWVPNPCTCIAFATAVTSCNIVSAQISTNVQ